MDEESKGSAGSEESIPNPVYEEVVESATNDKMLITPDIITQNGESGMESNDDDCESLSSCSSCSQDTKTKKRRNTLKSYETKNEIAIQNLSLDVSKEEKNTTTSKPCNIKLQLKNPLSYKLISGSLIKNVKNPNNQRYTDIEYEVTLISNTPNGPTFSTATYSPAGASQAKKLQQVTTNACQVVNTVPLLSAVSLSPKPQITQIPSLIQESPQENLNSEKVILEENKSKTSSEKMSGESDDGESNLEFNRQTSTSKNRELLQLQKTHNTSKVLSEYLNDDSVTKNRKSRKIPLKKGSDSEYSPGIRRRSICRSKSTPRTDIPSQDESALSKWPSEERINKRTNMRSQNTEFRQKHMKFMSKINAEYESDNSDCGEETTVDNYSKSAPSEENYLDVLKMKYKKHNKIGWDAFCWKCVTCGNLIFCSKCIRSYHLKCLKSQAPTKLDKNWVCPECCSMESFMKANSKSSKTPLSNEHLNQLMHFALKRMRQLSEGERFLENFGENEFPEYFTYIVKPMTLGTMEKIIEKRGYRYSEQLIADAKWIQHNASIYFGNNSKIAAIAKQIVKICRQEANEMETCPECYYNANTRKDWFVQVCSKPHILLWAKLKGFPYWPAKSMGVSSSLVNVRFFGEHDRANVPIKDCFLYSEKDPNIGTKQSKRNVIDDSLKEVEVHIRKISTKFGSFNYAPFRTPYDPGKELLQLEMMIPGVMECMKKDQSCSKPALTFKIVKTADNHLSMVKKHDVNGEQVVNDVNLNKSNSSVADISLNTSENNLLSTKSTYKSCVNESANLHEGKSSNNRKLNDDSVNAYEVVTKNDETDSNKINSVILKRKQDNWNASITSMKKQKVSVQSKDIQDNKISSEVPKLVESNKTVSKLKEDSKSLRRRQSNDDLKQLQAQRSKVPKSDNRASYTVKSIASITAVSSNGSSTASSNKSPSDEILSVHIGNSKLTGKSAPQNRTDIGTEKESDTSEVAMDIEEIPEQTNITRTNKNISQVQMNQGRRKSFKRDRSSSLLLTSQSFTMDSQHLNFENQTQHNKPSEIISQNDSTQKISEVSNQEKSLLIVNESVNSEDLLSSPDKDHETSSTNDQSSISSTNQQSLQTNKIVSRISALKPKQVQSSDNYMSEIENSSSSNSESSSFEQILIPFIDVKTENSNSDDENCQNNLSTDPEIVSVQGNSKTCENEVSKVVEIDTSNIETAENADEVIVIKSEVLSDEEDLPLKSSDVATNKLNVNANSNGQENIQCQRITVRDFATVRTDQRNKAIEKKGGKNENRRMTQRAKKSFPNKCPSSIIPTVSTAYKPPVIQSLIGCSQQNLNNMVLIPLDSKITRLQKNMPMPPPLTSVPTISFNNHIRASVTGITGVAGVTGEGRVGGGVVAGSQEISSLPALSNETSSLIANLGSVSLISRSNSINSPVTTTAVNSVNSNQPISQINQSPSTEQQNVSSDSEHMLSGFVAPSLASAITETIVRSAPQLIPKPARPLASDGDYVFSSNAGHVSKTLMENAHKMTDFFRSVLEDTLSDLASENNVPEAKIRLLELEIEQLKHSHEKEVQELKHNTDLMLCEMKKSLEKEKTRLIAETRKKCEMERIISIEEVKKKQWCANCGKESQFYCCWNTSYCDYPCQQKHWSQHIASCAQNGNPDPNAQKVGVKILSPYNMKNREVSIPRLPANTFLRPASVTAQAQRNAVPVHRFVSTQNPVTQPSPPPLPLQRFTIVNCEGNWGRIPQNQSSFQQRMQITSPSVTQEIQNNSGATTMPSSRIIDVRSISHDKVK